MFHKIAKLAILVSVVLTLNSQGLQEAEDMILRVTTGDVPSVPEVLHYHFNESGHPVANEGLTLDYLNWFTMKYNLMPVVVRYHSYLGQYKNDTTLPESPWVNVLEDLQNDVADMAVVATGLRPVFSSELTVSFALLDSAVYMYISYPVENNYVWSFLQPYQSICWIMMTISLLVLPFSLYFMNKISVPGQAPVSEKDAKFGPMFLYFLSVVTSQGGWLNPLKVRRFLVLSVAWCLACSVFTNAYNGLLLLNGHPSLISFLTLNVPKPVATTIDDLIANPQLNFYTFNNSQLSYVAYNAEGGAWKQLGDVLRQKPQATLPTVDDCLQKVEEAPNNVCIEPREVGDGFISERFRQTGRCTLTRVGDGILNYRPAFILRQDYKKINLINKAIIHARSYGLDRKWITNYGNGTGLCILDDSYNRKTRGFTKLNIKQTYGALIVLLIGIAAAVICFFYEISTHH